MSDDIVTRLREGKGNDIELFKMMEEAGDEIERLRADKAHLFHLWKVLMATVKAEQFANDKWIRGEIGAEELNLVATNRDNAFNAFDKAVRGE